MKYNKMFVTSDLPSLFNNDELMACFQRMNQGDLSARNEIIEHNIRFVMMIVLTNFSTMPYDIDELIAVGLIGFIKSVPTFDTNKGYLFKTYAEKCIKNEILDYCRSNKKHINYSLDKLIFDEIDDISFEEAIIDGRVDIEFSYERKECHEIIRRIVYDLPERYSQIIIMYFGFDDNPKTQSEIAKLLKMSQSNVNKIIKQALAIIKIKLKKQGIVGPMSGFQRRKQY